MSLFSRIAKKLRRRKRDKGTSKLDVSPKMTVAEDLIMSNWGLSFKDHKSAGAGTARRLKREKAKRKANEAIPSGDKYTRQRARQEQRAFDKGQRNLSYH